MDRVKIGLLGAGGISSRVARGITESPVCDLVYVAARDRERARLLAEKFLVSHYTDDYQEMLASDIEGVYITTINALHYQHIKLCLEKGKHVICEKPMLISSDEAEELYQLANEKGLLLLEAMKCRYLPTIKKTREILKAYSYPKTLLATFLRQEPFSFDYSHSYYDTTYGGAAKTIGCYVYSWALELFPEKIVKSDRQQMYHQGVDNSTWLYLLNDRGLFMQLGCSVDYDQDNQAIISGESYQIKVRDFWKSLDIEVWEKGQLVRTIKEDIGSEFRYQVDFFGQTIKKAAILETNRQQLEFVKRVIAFYSTSS